MPGLRVTFVGHDASPTGAPRVMLSLVAWVRAHTDARVRVVLLGGGALSGRFRAAAPTSLALGRVWPHLRRVIHGFEATGAGAPGGRVCRAGVRAVARVVCGPTDVLVCNTLASLEPVLGRRRPSERVICHVHELDGVADRVLPVPGVARDRLLGRVDVFIAAGRQVAEMLVERLGVPADRVRVLEECIDDPGPVVARREARVVAVGQAGDRKGTDLFVAMLAVLDGVAPGSASDPDRLLGLWLGGDPAAATWTEHGVDVAEAFADRPESRVEIRPTVGDPLGVVAGADVVVSTSREDPFPLAVLEAAAVGVPVAGFASGGLVDLLGRAGAADLVVPVGDVVGLARVVRSLLDDPSRRAAVGARLAAEARRHRTDEVAPRWWAIVTGRAG